MTHNELATAICLIIKDMGLPSAEDLVDDYNWINVFPLEPEEVTGCKGQEGGAIDIEDLETILMYRTKEGDMSEWDGDLVASTKDGRYVYAWGMCDTTGWG